MRNKIGQQLGYSFVSEASNVKDLREQNET